MSYVLTCPNCGPREVTDFGFGGSVLASDRERARQVAGRIESGMVWIKHPTRSRAELPFGGIERLFGYSREELLGRSFIVKYTRLLAF